MIKFIKVKDGDITQGEYKNKFTPFVEFLCLKERSRGFTLQQLYNVFNENVEGFADQAEYQKFKDRFDARKIEYLSIEQDTVYTSLNPNRPIETLSHADYGKILGYIDSWSFEDVDIDIEFIGLTHEYFQPFTLPGTGPMSASMINVELGRNYNAYFSINDPEVRALAGVPTGEIKFSDFYGKLNTKNISRVTIGFASPNSSFLYFQPYLCSVDDASLNWVSTGIADHTAGTIDDIQNINDNNLGTYAFSIAQNAEKTVYVNHSTDVESKRVRFMCSAAAVSPTTASVYFSYTSLGVETILSSWRPPTGDIAGDFLELHYDPINNFETIVRKVGNWIRI
jgi:hypothetical protein